ncbi:putative Tir chaperone family protein [Gammaproteobacteria bacterium]
MTKDQIQQALGTFGERAGLPGLALDDNDGCSLQVDDRYTLDIAWKPPHLHLMASVASIPGPEALATTYAVLMEAHLFGAASGGAYFGANQVLGEILLVRTLDDDTLTGDRLSRVLDEYVPAVKFWTIKLTRGLRPEDAESVGLEISAPPMIFHP